MKSGGDVDSFARAVFALVRRVPRGRVVTYGQVAALLGHPRAARAVGNALGRLNLGRSRVVPWHRVVNAGGKISRRGDAEAADRQRHLLEDEGVPFSRSGRIDLRRHAWRERTSLRREADAGKARKRGARRSPGSR